MSVIEIKADEKMVKEIMDKLDKMQKKEGKKALKSAVNETAKFAKKRLSILTKERYDLKKGNKEIKNSLKIVNAKYSQTTATLKSKEERLEVKDFKAKPLTITNDKLKGKKRKKSKRSGVKARVIKGSQVKELTIKGGEKNGHDLKAFVTKFESGHVSVVRRVPGKKMKSNPKKDFLEKIISPSLPEIISSKRNMKIAEPEIEEFLNDSIKKHIKQVLGG